MSSARMKTMLGGDSSPLSGVNHQAIAKSVGIVMNRRMLNSCLALAGYAIQEMGDSEAPRLGKARFNLRRAGRR